MPLTELKTLISNYLTEDLQLLRFTSLETNERDITIINEICGSLITVAEDFKKESFPTLPDALASDDDAIRRLTRGLTDHGLVCQLYNNIHGLLTSSDRGYNRPDDGTQITKVRNIVDKYTFKLRSLKKMLSTSSPEKESLLPQIHKID